MNVSDPEDQRRETARAAYDWESRNFAAVTPAGFARAAGWKYVPDEKKRTKIAEGITAGFAPRTIEQIESLFSVELDKRLSVFMLPDPSGTPKDEYRKAVYPYVRQIREEIPTYLAKPWRKWKDAVKACRVKRKQEGLPTEEEREAATTAGKEAIESALAMFATLSRELHPARQAVKRAVYRFGAIFLGLDQARKVEYHDNAIVTGFAFPLFFDCEKALVSYLDIEQPTAQTIQLLKERIQKFLQQLGTFADATLDGGHFDNPVPLYMNSVRDLVLVPLLNAPEAGDALQCGQFDPPEIGEVDYTGVSEGQEEPDTPPKSGRELSHMEKVHLLHRQMEEAEIAKFKGTGAFNLDEIQPRRFFEKLGMKYPENADEFRARCTRLKMRPDDPRSIEDVECIFLCALRETLAPLWAEDASNSPLVKYVFPHVRKRLDGLSNRKWTAWKDTVAACKQIVSTGGKLTDEDRRMAENVGTSARYHLSNILHSLFYDLTPCRKPIEGAISALHGIFGIELPFVVTPEDSIVTGRNKDALEKFSKENPKAVSRAVEKALKTFQTIRRITASVVREEGDEEFSPDQEAIKAIDPKNEGGWNKWLAWAGRNDCFHHSPITKAWEALLILADELRRSRTKIGTKFAADVQDAVATFARAPETCLALSFDCELHDPDFGTIDWTGCGTTVEQAESEVWTRKDHPNMRPCVCQCQPGKWIWFNGDKDVKHLYSAFQWKILKQLLEVPGEGWAELETGWSQKFSGGSSKKDVKDVRAHIVSESGGPGSGGTHRYRLE